MMGFWRSLLLLTVATAVTCGWLAITGFAFGTRKRRPPADGEPEAPHSIGYYGPRDLTGVAYDESHDGAWWRAWWEKNRQDFPEDVRSREIPTITLPKG